METPWRLMSLCKTYFSSADWEPDAAVGGRPSSTGFSTTTNLHLGVCEVGWMVCGESVPGVPGGEGRGGKGHAHAGEMRDGFSGGVLS